MFVKLARSRGHTYAQLVESFRDANSQPRQRNLLTLGRVDENGGQVDKVLQSLLKARGHGPPALQQRHGDSPLLSWLAMKLSRTQIELVCKLGQQLVCLGGDIARTARGLSLATSSGVCAEVYD
jgi:hypothetical protein